MSEDADQIGPNIFKIKRTRCQRRDGSNWKFDHGPFILDEEMALVECGNCGEKLNPMAVLLAYAKSESRIGYRFEELKATIAKTTFKAQSQNRVRCEHCDKLARIRKDAK